MTSQSIQIVAWLEKCLHSTRLHFTATLHLFKLLFILNLCGQSSATRIPGVILFSLKQNTLANWDHTVPAPSDGPARVAWRALEILVVLNSASKREGTCPMKVKQSLAWYGLQLLSDNVGTRRGQPVLAAGAAANSPDQEGDKGQVRSSTAGWCRRRNRCPGKSPCLEHCTAVWKRAMNAHL